MSPLPYTLWQLLYMLEGARERDWETTSHIMAMIANVNRNPKKRHKPFSAREFNPTVQVSDALPWNSQTKAMAKQAFFAMLRKGR